MEEEKIKIYINSKIENILENDLKLSVSREIGSLLVPDKLKIGIKFKDKLIDEIILPLNEFDGK